jgi:penicillin-binding protein 2
MGKDPVDEEDIPIQFRDHAWFATYVPAERPRIAIAVLVEHGGHGGSAAAPIARAIVDEFLKNEAADEAAPPPTEPVQPGQPPVPSKPVEQIEARVDARH